MFEPTCVSQQDWDDVITFKKHMEMDSKGIKRIYLTDTEYYRDLYKIALKYLEELAKQQEK